MEVREISKEHVLIKLDPEIAKKLRYEKAETRRTYSEIIEDALRERFAATSLATTA